jgi:hypothetical protein
LLVENAEIATAFGDTAPQVDAEELDDQIVALGEGGAVFIPFSVVNEGDCAEQGKVDDLVVGNHQEALQRFFSFHL